MPPSPPPPSSPPLLPLLLPPPPPLLLLLLLHAFPSLATDQGGLCVALGGVCVTRDLCWARTLPSLCVHPHVCCASPDKLVGVTVSKARLREVCPTTKKCARAGGECGTARTPCNTWREKTLCKGFCSCCVGDHRSCETTPACKLRGGLCFKGGWKTCRHGTVLQHACTRDKCFCCVPSKCSCGISNGERIVGGMEVTVPHKYPWLVGLKTRKSGDTYYCGGTIISPRFILTAAHCLYDQTNGRLLKPRHLRVGVGDHNQASKEDDIPAVTSLVKVDKIIVHEEYSFFEIYYDIGLVRLGQALDLTSHIQIKAVCLPTDSSNMYEDATGMVYGWGVTYSAELTQPDVVREVALPIWNKECKGKRVANIKISSHMVCAGEEGGGKDTCLGDSGGPLTVLQDNRHVLVGITSFGFGCGLPGSPGVYTRLTAYLQWIMANVQDNFCN